jgi:hypothetical protein
MTQKTQNRKRLSKHRKQQLDKQIQHKRRGARHQATGTAQQWTRTTNKSKDNQPTTTTPKHMDRNFI